MRAVFLAVDVNGVACTHFTFDAKHRAIGVYDCLTLCNLSYKSFTVFGECDNGRRCTIAFRISDYDGFAAFQNCNTTVSSTKVDTDNFTHNIYTPLR